jgi:cobalt/nickel transport protein
MTTKRDFKFYAIFFAAALVLAAVFSFYASSSPDGLEKVAGDIGFLDTAKDHANSDFALADYGVAGVENERFSVGLAGTIGVVTTGVVAVVLFMALGRKKKQ